MTEIATILDFFSGVLPTYPNDAVPDDVSYPYATIEPRIGYWDDGDVLVQLQVWCRTTTELEPNAYVRKLAEHVGYGGTALPCDGGWVWIKRGTPWSVVVQSEHDDAVKRRIINLTIEFMTYI